VTSGLRVGTAQVTTRGMGEPEMTEIAEIIAAVVANPEKKPVLKKAGDQVAELVGRFPLT
jgi:glycine hydroxymethyltransferase